jgi:hypothetical protein
MMQINRNNYEAFLLDYLEGTLDEKGRGELALFFVQNPDLKKNIDDYEDIRLLPVPDIVYGEKHLLRKNEIRAVGPINKNNFEEWIIASLEKDLSQAGQDRFQEFVKINPTVQQEIVLYKNTYLVPGETIVYQPKEGLKKKVPFYFFKSALWPASVAALLIVLFGIALLLNNLKQPSTNNQSLVTGQIKGTEGAQVETATGPEEIYRDGLTFHVNDSLDSEKGIKFLAEADVVESTDEPVDGPQLVSDDSYADNITIQRLTLIVFSGQLLSVNDEIVQIPKRTEMTEAFEYLKLRDALKADRKDPQKGKSTIGKIFAGLGNKIFGTSNDEAGSLLGGIANRSRESLNEFAESMPVYRESDESGRTNTYLALNENLKLRISKNRNNPE